MMEVSLCSEKSITPNYVKTNANPDTKVLLLPGKLSDGNHKPIIEFIEDWDYDYDNDEFGPSCFLCNKEIIPDCEKCVIEDTVYSVMWAGDVKGYENGDDNVGIMQCCYCFNVFHRFKCSLSMPTSTYINMQLSKLWTCPLCVPEFRPSTKMSKNKPIISMRKLLVAVFKCLYQDLKYQPSNIILPGHLHEIEIFCKERLLKVVSDYVTIYEIG